MPRRAGSDDQVFIATQTFTCDVAGEPQFIRAGETRVAGGHELLKRYAGYFKPVEEGVHFGVETATAAPGEKRMVPVPTRTAE